MRLAQKKGSAKMIATIVRHVIRLPKNAVVEQFRKRAAIPLVIRQRGTETVAIQSSVTTYVLLTVVVVVVIHARASAEQSSFAMNLHRRAHLGALVLKLGVSVEGEKAALWSQSAIRVTCLQGAGTLTATAITTARTASCAGLMDPAIPTPNVNRNDTMSLAYGNPSLALVPLWQSFLIVLYSRTRQTTRLQLLPRSRLVALALLRRERLF